ncbi:MAG: 4a-hydroxytetrahydrobiopterin dehydratase [Flavobacteriales bacterium]|nr:4a-hydroxytetrahydrobiopterin dehydratase [Bacteroidota bacterium]MCB9239641.1 4a-hydroxytetrahydrobiopterin dehydratase [Flavobacteriales bacterium]
MAWEERENALHKTYTFKSFEEAIGFMKASAPEIEALNHHPEWTNVYNRVSCRLTTHDAGNTVTGKDHQLSQLLDTCYQAFTT